MKPWDEAERPRGPGRAKAGYDQAYGFGAGQQLMAVHNHLRAELTQLQVLIAAVADGTLDARDARQELMAMSLRRGSDITFAFCQAYCRLVTMHHTIEDRSVFPHLRRSDPQLGAVLDRLQFEHGAIHELIVDIDRALAKGSGGPPEAARLGAALDALSQALLSHLAYEEEELVGPLTEVGFF